MAKTLKKVSEFPLATDPRNVDVFGQDSASGQSVKVNTKGLVGDTGPAPNITIKMQALAYGSTPSVDKSGTDVAPVFTIGFPLAKNGDTPMFQKTGDAIQYRYTDAEQWQTLFDIDTLRLHFTDLTPEQVDSLKLHFSDLTEDEIALLQQPANDARDAANEAAENANTAADRLNNLSDHPAKIQDGYWWLWNETTEEYENTGQRADGNTLFAAFEIDPDTGLLSVNTPDGYDGPNFRLDENGNLIVVI